MTACLAVGTAQLGLPYGLNHTGKPVEPTEARSILEAASKAGITLLDTAPAYGDIESRLSALCRGLPFSVLSKIAGFEGNPSAVGMRAWVERSVEISASHLDGTLIGLLFHRAEDLLGPCGDIAWQTALDCRPEGVRLGVSVYSPDEAILIRKRYPIELVQLPGNALDQRLNSAVETGALLGVEIHLRSIFLQGLLVTNESVPHGPNPRFRDPLSRWRTWCSENSIDPTEAALSIAKGLPSVAACVIGFDSACQAKEIFTAWQKAKPIRAPELANDDPFVIDPRRWADA